MADFRIETGADGVAVVYWDQPGTSINVLTLEAVAELDRVIAGLLGEAAVKGIVITSAKKDFAGGMDLNVIARMKENAGDDPARGLFDGIMSMHHALRRIERAGMDPKTLKGGKPVAFANPGTCAGIGTEIGLACHRRFMADNPKGRIGLPEILLGIFPGAGGTTRVSRMMDIMSASPILLEGRMMEAAKAKAAGLVDEIVEPDQLLARARAWVLAAGPEEIVKPWDQKGFKYPGGAPYHPAGYMTFVGASAMVHGKTQGAYPAARAMLSAIYEGALVNFDAALRIEARWFTQVLMNPSSAAMIRALFINKGALEKGAVRPQVPESKVKKLGVLGAGMMGAGIAHAAIGAGIDTVLIDRDDESVARGRAAVEALLNEALARKRLSADEVARRLSLLTATPDYARLQGADLVVEAVFEDPAVKAEATGRAEPYLAEGGVFATNTSTLPIGELARASRNDAAFIGIHFFSPVHKMNLVEIIRGRATGDAAVAKALDFVRQLKKTPIVVNDARFFYANRCIIPYLNEGARMVGEGVPPALVDNAARQIGMPVGPLQLIDETSIDLGVKIAKATRAAMGAAYPAAESDRVLFALAEAGRLGRKVKAGFYAYDSEGERLGFWEGLAKLWPRAATRIPPEDVKSRLILAQVIEAVKALEEQVLTDIREGDVGAILGWGFMPWSGGPFAWIDMTGADRVAALCDDLEKRYGSRFSAPKLLRDMAAQGAKFYEKFAPEAA
jgi:3-hydroxyacyl-CoA dehydrogenase/enoyl-CoA hydratase/3-hydroxybutyryl-CoA epimerase